MRSKIHATDGNASLAAAQPCHDSFDHGDNGTIVPPTVRFCFALMARELWQFKVAAHLHHLLGASERTCRAWASGDRDAPAWVLAALIEGADGHRVLAYLMRDDPPKWWADVVEDRRQAAILRAAMRDVAQRD